VCGQLLNLYKVKDTSLESALASELNTLLNKMKVSSNPLQNTMEAFSRIINRVSLFYPPIVQIHSKDLLFIFPKLKDKGKASVLESLSSSTEAIPDLFIELRGTYTYI
jgi:hypothetical protein